MRHERCEPCLQWAASVVLGSSAFLAVLKLVVGLTSGSKGCIADSLYSATIFVMALVGMVGQRLARKEERAKFPYGYGKIQAVIAGSTTFLIACVAGVLIWKSTRHLIGPPQYGPPYYTALVMAHASVVANYLLSRYLRCVARQCQSSSMMSNARAFRENFIAAIIVLIGVIGAKLGLRVLDPLAALLVVALIMKACIKIMVESVQSLMDVSVNGTYGKKIRAIIKEVEGVERISGVRTRQIGDKIWVDLDICIDPQQKIRDANLIAQKVRKILLRQIDDLEQVIVNCRPLKEGRC